MNLPLRMDWDYGLFKISIQYSPKGFTMRKIGVSDKVTESHTFKKSVHERPEALISIFFLFWIGYCF